MNSQTTVEKNYVEKNYVPDLASYDHIVVNSSAGKDSQAMLDYVYGLAKAAGCTDKMVVVHCDLGRVEWQGTRELAQEQAEHYGLRFEVVQRSEDLLDHIERHGKFPDSANRYCTSDHKRGQVDKLLTQLADETVTSLMAEMTLADPRKKYKRKDFGQVRILSCMGFRADESPARAKRPAFDHGNALRANKKGTFTLGRGTNTRRLVDQWLPIHGWTVEQVWARIKASGVKHHFAYDLGMRRLSCCFCIMADKASLVLAARHNMDLAKEYARVEDKIGHKFRLDLPMSEIVRLAEQGADVGKPVDFAM